MGRTLVFAILTVAVTAWGQSDLRWFTVTPTSLSFTAADPDAGGVPAASSTAQWRTRLASPARTWTLSVQALSPTLQNCSNIPVSALRLTCTSAFINDPKGSAACVAGAVPLSTTPRALASGQQGTGNDTTTITFSAFFTDSWKYSAAQAPACTVNLTYTIDVP
jgi:hypothetical protein